MKSIYAKIIQFRPVRVVYGIVAAVVIKLPRIAFFALAFFVIFWVGQQLYYKYESADHFLNYYYAKVDDTPVGTEPLVTLCRHYSEGALTIAAQRTFIQLIGSDQKPQVVGSYNFNADIERTDGNCQTLRLHNQPMVAGTYKIHTEYVFNIHGYRKVGEYDSNAYKMTPPVLTVDEQIQQLQNEINDLNNQLEMLKEQKAGTGSTGASTGTGSPAKTTAPSSAAPATTTPTQPSTPLTSNPAPVTIPTPQCSVNLLGIGVGCGSDGILRL